MKVSIPVDSGPLLVFGGPYSNLAATTAMRQVAERLGIAPANCVCTGDVVAYCAHPEETVDAIRDWGVQVVMGNCEESLGGGSDDCGCGFDAGSACSVLSDDWYAYSRRRLGEGNLAWMRSLPRQVSFELAGLRFLVIPGSVSRINRFVFPSTSAHEKRAELDHAAAEVVIGGHAGIPFGEQLGNRYWLNAGAIGLPANDGTRDGWYLLLVPGDGAVLAQWHRLRYDAASEAKAMCNRGMQPDYADTLLTGLWPSLDVLPVYERRQQGIPLQPMAIRISLATEGAAMDGNTHDQRTR